GLVATNIYHHEGPRRPAGLVWAVALSLLAQDADHGVLPLLHAAVADIPGDSFAGPSHLMHMRGAPELIDRSAPARDPNSPAPCGTPPSSSPASVPRSSPSIPESSCAAPPPTALPDRPLTY